MRSLLRDWLPGRGLAPRSMAVALTVSWGEPQPTFKHLFLSQQGSLQPQRSASAAPGESAAYEESASGWLDGEVGAGPELAFLAVSR